MKFLSKIQTEDRAFFCSIGALFVFYVILIVVFSPEGTVGDESRYLFYAENLSNGFYVPDDYPDFTNGPIYPAILTPFVMMEAPLLAMRMLNAFFLVGALIFFYHAAKILVPSTLAMISALVLGLNPIQLRYIAHAKTETISVFFFCAFLWALVHLFRENKLSLKWLTRASIFFALLALTRVLFGYVATAALVAIPVACLVFGYRNQMLKAVSPFALGLLLCVPWLTYTYKHTGNLFCWSTNGGELVYWITSPYDGEWGSWFSLDDLADKPEAAKRHMRISAAIESSPYSQQDALWKQYAMENIRENPMALVRNLGANFSRIFFGFPRSYRTEELKTIFWVLPSAFILSLALIAVYPSIRGWRKIPLAIKISGLVGLIFFGGSVLLPAEPRYLLPVVPAMLLWLTFVYGRLVQIKFTAPEVDYNSPLHGGNAP